MTREETSGKASNSRGALFFTSAHDNGEPEFDLAELILRLVDHIKLIIFFALTGASLAAACTLYLITPQYEATSKLYVLNSSDSALNLSDLQIGSYLASDYIEVFKTWEVHEMVISNLALNYTYAEMQDMLTVENPTGTRILYITVISPSADEAAAIANEYASVAIKYIADTMSTDEPNIMSVALVPTNPASPDLTQNILIGFTAGLLLSTIWFTIRYLTDDKIKTMEDVQKYAGLPVLAIIPEVEEEPEQPKQPRKKGA